MLLTPSDSTHQSHSVSPRARISNILFAVSLEIGKRFQFDLVLWMFDTRQWRTPKSRPRLVLVRFFLWIAFFCVVTGPVFSVREVLLFHIIGVS